jgi:2-dehydropantoate 2-reductase
LPYTVDITVVLGGEVMIITIAGCGALGSLLAARLIEGGIQVQAFQRQGAQLEALRQQGITVEGDRTGRTRRFQLAAVSDDASQLQPSRLIVVLVKAYSTEEVYPIRENLRQGGVVLTLQNGLGNPEKLAPIFGEEMVAAGVATYGAYRTAPGVIRWGGDGAIVLGPWQRGLDMSWIGELLSGGGLSATYVDDPRPAIWRKLAINAMVNTTAALTRMKNGELLVNPMALEMMQKLGQETAVAARRAGVGLDFDELWSLHLENLERTAANKPSMLQDVEAGRQTEIEAISGGVLQYARDENEFPYTRSVYALLKAMDIKRGHRLGAGG